MAPSQPKVSILLPTYNGVAFLSAAIESVLNQSFSNFELIIADDGSSDGTREIAANFAQSDARIRFTINTKNLGLFENYNYCISLCQGEYIKPFAQDDVLAPNALSRMIEVLDQQPDVALVSAAREYITGDGEHVETVRRFSETTRLCADEAIADNLFSFSNWIGEPCAVMFRREHAGSGFCTDYCHYGDIEYWLRLLENGAYMFLPEVLVRFRAHKTSGTQKNYQGLGVISDVWKLARSYEAFAQKRGMGRNDFYNLVIENIASQIHHSVERLGVGVEQIWQSSMPPLAEQEIREILTRSLLDLARQKREATSAAKHAEDMHARMNDLHAQIEMLTNRIHTLDAEKQKLQSELSDVHGSVAWRLTKPIRLLSSR